MSDREETHARLDRAIQRLEELQASVRMHEEIRLGGKIEGVKLALSYMEEEDR